MAIYVSAFDRIADKFTIGDGCWLWTGTLDPNGYGTFGEPGRKGEPAQKITAHRFIYNLLVDEIPEGLELDHLCRVRNCVRPDHLEPVTHAENVRRAVYPTGTDHHCGKKTHCPQGHPYAGKNLSIQKNGARRCLACHRAKVAGRDPQKELAA